MRTSSHPCQIAGARRRFDPARRLCPTRRSAALAIAGLFTLSTAAAPQLGVAGAELWRQGANGLKGAPAADHDFGHRVVVGDFNGDGRGDVAVTAPLADVDEFDQTGTVQVVYGGAENGLDGDEPDDQILALGVDGAPGESWAGEQFGLGGVASGDFDADGFDDLAIATVFDVVDGEGGVGSVLVVPGTATGLDPAAALYIVGNEIPLPAGVEFRRFGHTVTAGDFDGDGFDDLAVGHRATVDDLAGAGAVHVFYGSASSIEVGASTQTFRQGADGIPGIPEEFDLFGSSLASGDFDGDGDDELAIAAISDTGNAPGAESSGSVTIVLGSPAGLDPTESEQWIRPLVEPQASFPQFGDRLATGDFDGDGHDDLVASDTFEDVQGVSATGAVWLRKGGLEGLGPGVRLVPGAGAVPLDPTPGLQFGDALTAGDFDDDGRDDLAVGTVVSGPGPGVFQPGAVAVLYGAAGAFDPARSQVFSPATSGMPGEEADQLGFGAAIAAGNVAAGGAEDLVVGIPYQRIDGLPRVGAFVVLPGLDPSQCQASGTAHCLQKGRFRAEVSFEANGEEPASAHAVPAVADDSGLFWFFEEDNWEIQVKVLNGCAINGHFWVFSAATTDVAYTLTVTDTETGGVREYTSPAGAAQALADTSAFSTCLVAAAEKHPAAVQLVAAAPLPAPSEDACPGDPQQLCLHDGRFQLTVDWTTHDGTTGKGQDVPVSTSDSGLFWFFDEDNWEMLVKVLDGCSLNGKFWVFAAATTDVAYRLRVYDRLTQVERVYENPSGVLATAVTDTEAFGGCP